MKKSRISNKASQQFYYHTELYKERQVYQGIAYLVKHMQVMCSGSVKHQMGLQEIKLHADWWPLSSHVINMFESNIHALLYTSLFWRHSQASMLMIKTLKMAWWSQPQWYSCMAPLHRNTPMSLTPMLHQLSPMPLQLLSWAASVTATSQGQGSCKVVTRGLTETWPLTEVFWTDWLFKLFMVVGTAWTTTMTKRYLHHDHHCRNW